MYNLNKIIDLEKETIDLVRKSKLDFHFLFLYPDNLKEAKARILDSKGKTKLNFIYKKNNSKIKSLEKEYCLIEEKFDNLIDLVSNQNSGTIFLKDIYKKKQNELLNFYKIIASVGDNENLTKYSLLAYGKPSYFIYLFAKYLIKLNNIKNKIASKKETTISHQNMKKAFDNYASKNKMVDFELTFEDIISIALTRSDQKKIILNKNVEYTEKEFNALLLHELGVHVKRFKNGQEISPIFSLGLAKYDFLEEGLAKYNELKIKDYLSLLYNPSLKVCSVYLSLKYDFNMAYKKLNKICKSPERSFDYLMRAKRGTDGINKGAYTKDYLYFKGFWEVVKFRIFNRFNINNNGINFKDLWIGKISFDEIDKINIIKKFKKLINHKKRITL